MNQIGKQIYSMDQIAGEYLKTKKLSANASVQKAETSFQDILQQKKLGLESTLQTGQSVTFSKHANERLNLRNIHLTDMQMQRLNQGVEQARGRNINESLVMLDDLAFIVNVRNNTVVTALDQSGEAGHVFTNIDGAVII